MCYTKFLQFLFFNYDSGVAQIMGIVHKTVAREITRVWNKDSSGFGGLEVACWPLVPKFAGSNPAEAVGFFMAKKKILTTPSLRKGIKAVGPMS
jgi:hypothetical protein